MSRFILILSLIFLVPPNSARAQLSPANNLGVAMGHLHYHVRDVEGNRKFWIELGARPVNIGTKEGLELPGVIVMLDQAESSGGTEGSVVNHVGFRVPDVARFMAKMKAAGYRVLSSTVSPATVGNTFSPEGERIELLQDLSENLQFTFDDVSRQENGQQMTVPIALHHIHFYVPTGSVTDIKAWYGKVFGALPGKRYHYEAADLPGVNLNFSDVPTKLAFTQGRMLDHIGFEVQNLEAFCKRLEASGVKLDLPYKKLPSGVAFAFLTDPWGTRIEMTEGFRKHQ
jgi:catechol 2,3-dioxygenase-like lactoylglutathione lyase family enzyme